jgi:hypothetical protein
VTRIVAIDHPFWLESEISNPGAKLIVGKGPPIGLMEDAVEFQMREIQPPGEVASHCGLPGTRGTYHHDPIHNVIDVRWAGVTIRIGPVSG